MPSTNWPAPRVRAWAYCCRLAPLCGRVEARVPRFFADPQRWGPGRIERPRPRVVQAFEVTPGRRPVVRVVQPEVLGLATRDFGVDPVDGDPPDVPEGAGPRSVGVEEVEWTGFAHGELEVEAGHVRHGRWT